MSKKSKFVRVRSQDHVSAINAYASATQHLIAPNTPVSRNLSHVSGRDVFIQKDCLPHFMTVSDAETYMRSLLGAVPKEVEHLI